MKKYRLLIFIPIVLFFLVSCSAVGRMPLEVDNMVREMRPPDGKALVYILRPTSFGGIVIMEVTSNGNYIGATGGGRYIYAILEPGNNTLVSKAENKSELQIVLEAGKTYYFEQKVKMGIIMARNELIRLDDAEGREKLLKCALSKDLTVKPE